MQCAWRRGGPPTGVCSVLHLPLWDPHSVGTPQLGMRLLTLPTHDCSTAETGQRAGPGSRIPSLPHARPVPLLQGPEGDGRDDPLHPTPLPRPRARALSDPQINGHWEIEKKRAWELERFTKQVAAKLIFDIHIFRKKSLLSSPLFYSGLFYLWNCIMLLFFITINIIYYYYTY